MIISWAEAGAATPKSVARLTLATIKVAATMGKRISIINVRTLQQSNTIVIVANCFIGCFYSGLNAKILCTVNSTRYNILYQADNHYLRDHL